jgi:GTPase
MHFIDDVTLTAEGGMGGRGCASFRRERSIRWGGPNGGNGGMGGHVYVRAMRTVHTLEHHTQGVYRAGNGRAGQSDKKAGSRGQDLYIEVPIGTSIYNMDNVMIADLTQDGAHYLLSEGGQRGLGNTCFKSSKNRTPRITKPPESGNVTHARLVLTMLADVALVGMPNAGKSTLLDVFSDAKPLIGDYPFTTLYPQLGTHHLPPVCPMACITLVDLPGVWISESRTIGLPFLKHIARTKIIWHVISLLHTHPLQNMIALQTMLTHVKQPQWLVFTHLDAAPDWPKQHAHLLPTSQPIFYVSGTTGIGLDTLLNATLHHMLTLS